MPKEAGLWYKFLPGVGAVPLQLQPGKTQNLWENLETSKTKVKTAPAQETLPPAVENIKTCL